MTASSENVYFNVLNDIANKYCNHKTTNMKPIDIKCDTFPEYNEESNEKGPKFKVGDHVRIFKYLLFVIKQIKNTVPWTYVISELNGEEIIVSFYEKELQKANRKEFRIEKVIKRKGNKLYLKWKRYNNLFNSWTDKKDLIK